MKANPPNPGPQLSTSLTLRDRESGETGLREIVFRIEHALMHGVPLRSLSSDASTLNCPDATRVARVQALLTGGALAGQGITSAVSLLNGLYGRLPNARPHQFNFEGINSRSSYV